MHLSGNPLTKTLKVFCLKSLKILINQLGGWGWGESGNYRVFEMSKLKLHNIFLKIFFVLTQKVEVIVPLLESKLWKH